MFAGFLLIVLPLILACEPLEPRLQTYKTLKDYVDHEPDEAAAYQILMNNEASRHGAYCLDGSVPDFYYRPGVDDGVHKFSIYLQGGGWCASLEHCATRTGTYLGSSKYDQEYMNLANAAPYLSSSKSINPLSYNWNTVYIRYCDGSSYSSNNDTLYPYNSTLKLYFRGWRILNGVLNVLRNKYDLISATDVLFSGCSAGALGVFFHADYIYKRILEFTNKAFKYMAMPDAGYFMEVPHYQGMMEFNWYYGNVSIGLNQNCVYHYKERNMNIIECMYAVNIAPFVESKMFSLQSQYDSNQIANMGTNNTELINEYGHNLTSWYIDRYINTSSKHYGWLMSCYKHCSSNLNTWNDVVIDRYTVYEAQMNAWFDNVTYSNLLFQNSTYPCSTCC